MPEDLKKYQTITTGSIIGIFQIESTNHRALLNMVSMGYKNINILIRNMKLNNMDQPELCNSKFITTSRDECLILIGKVQPAGWDGPKPSWFDFSRCIQNAMVKLLNEHFTYIFCSQ